MKARWAAPLASCAVLPLARHGEGFVAKPVLRQFKRPAACRQPYDVARRPTGIVCSLTPLSYDTATRLLPVVATREQWTQYWGRTEVQRAGKFFEAAVVTFLGLWACYFTSFFVGVSLMSVLGAGFAFYWLLGPSLSAYRKNSALRSCLEPPGAIGIPGKGGGVAALFSARIKSVREEFNPVTRRALRLLLLVEDEEGRALQFRVSMAPEYRKLREGMRLEVVLVASDAKFEAVEGVSDAFVPAADVWVGEYPYLERVQFRRLLAARYGAPRVRSRGGRDWSREEEEEDAVAAAAAGGGSSGGSAARARPTPSGGRGAAERDVSETKGRRRPRFAPPQAPAAWRERREREMVPVERAARVPRSQRVYEQQEEPF